MRFSGLLARAVAVILVATPLAVVAPAMAVEPTIPTDLVWELSPTGTVPYQTDISIEGQAVYVDPEDGEEYAALGVFRLEQRYLGVSTWTHVEDALVDNPFLAYFSFEVTALRNTEYRVTFMGDDTYLPSVNTGIVKVARTVSSKSSEPRRNVFYLSGKVRPAYADKTVSLMRKKCASCSWKAYASKTTTDASTYRFRLPLPPRGDTHYFKVRAPKDERFVKSFSTTWVLSTY